MDIYGGGVSKNWAKLLFTFVKIIFSVMEALKHHQILPRHSLVPQLQLQYD
jgi:hypothetical protein